MNILQNNSSKRFSMDIFHFYMIIFVLGFDEPISGESSYLVWSLILLCTFCGCPSMSFKDEIKLHFDRPSIHKYDDKLNFFPLNIWSSSKLSLIIAITVKTGFN